MAVRKRGKSWQFEISYKKATGEYSKIRKGGFKTKAEAKEAEIEMSYNLGRGYQADKNSLTLYDFFKNWIELYKENYVSEITYKKYLNTLSAIKELFPYTTLSSLDKANYQKSLNNYAKTHARSTTAKLNNHIKSALDDAVDQGLILRNPTYNVVIKGLPSKPTENKYLNYDEFQALMQLLETRINPTYASPFLLFFAGATGMRLAELMGLTWSDIDFDNGIVDVNKTWLYKLSKFGPTKNPSSLRKIPIDNKTLSILKKYKSDQDQLISNIGIDNPNNFIFFNIKNGPVSQNAVTKQLRVRLKELGIDKSLSIHGLRHTHASVLLYKGVNILSVSKRLGHADINTTMKTYLHTIKELEEKDNTAIKNIMENIY